MAQLLWKMVGELPKSLNTELVSNPATQFLVTDPKESKAGMHGKGIIHYGQEAEAT